MGKARSPADANDFLKAALNQSADNYGNQRLGYQGTGQDRGSTVGVAKVDPDSNFKLDRRGGIMRGSIAWNGLATAELAADGIIDMTIYNSPRLYITNTGGNTLKVIIPSLGDGQEVWIRSNGGVSTNIQDTAGTGDETTGNIETMAAATYTMTGDDWICFHYDQTDSKFHQVTAGKQNIGGGGGSGDNLGNHTATQDLEMQNHDLLFGTNGSIRYLASTGYLYAGVTNVARYSTTLFSFLSDVRPHQDSTYTLGTSSRYWSHLYTDNITMNGDINLSNNDTIFFGANRIQSDSTGNLEYSVTDSADDHEFFVGGVAQATIQSTGLTLFNSLQANSQTIENSGAILFASTGTITGSSVGWSGLTGDMYGNVASGDSYFLRVNGTTAVEVDEDGLDIKVGWLELNEIIAPSGLANHVRIYMDNLSGTKRLVANVNGVVTVLATD